MDTFSKAKGKIGSKYVYGDQGPNTFDCSGLALWVHAQVGIKLPRTSSEQGSKDTQVSTSSLKPGDLVFFDTNGKGGTRHVGIYSGNGHMVHAPGTGKTVCEVSISQWYKDRMKGARRYW